MKFCKRCGKHKALEDFCKNRRKPDGLNFMCKMCDAAAGRRWRKHNRARVYELRIQREYGLTPEQHEQLRSDQSGRCALCEEAVELYIDHSHETGQVRGLLCQTCNLGLGHYERLAAFGERLDTYLHLSPDERRKVRNG